MGTLGGSGETIDRTPGHDHLGGGPTMTGESRTGGTQGRDQGHIHHSGGRGHARVRKPVQGHP